MSNSKRGPGTHHVVPNHGGGWDVRRGGAERASGHFPTKAQAVDSGREVSRKATNASRSSGVAPSPASGASSRAISFMKA